MSKQDSEERSTSEEANVRMLKDALQATHRAHKDLKRSGELRLRWRAGNLHNLIRERLREIEESGLSESGAP